MALQEMWGSVAPGWAEHADFIDERALPLTYRMLERTAPQKHERVLELACGPGSLAQCHVAGEYLETRQLLLASQVYAQMLVEWCA